MAPQIPRIISVDDHVIEPPNVWQDRLPEKFKAVGPRIERRKVKNMKFVGGVFSYDTAADNRVSGYWRSSMSHQSHHRPSSSSPASS